jgi:hypothetical protein
MTIQIAKKEKKARTVTFEEIQDGGIFKDLEEGYIGLKLEWPVTVGMGKFNAIEVETGQRLDYKKTDRVLPATLAELTVTFDE